jgi:hypothetical protein
VEVASRDHLYRIFAASFVLIIVTKKFSREVFGEEKLNTIRRKRTEV